jgi:hypothetical protein
MTSFYAAFIANISARDTSLLQLAFMAAAAVATWYIINSSRMMPWPRVQRLMRFGYLVGGLVMYALSYIMLKLGGS